MCEDVSFFELLNNNVAAFVKTGDTISYLPRPSWAEIGGLQEGGAVASRTGV